jgi:hypothetical protein
MRSGGRKRMRCGVSARDVDSRGSKKDFGYFSPVVNLTSATFNPARHS